MVSVFVFRARKGLHPRRASRIIRGVKRLASAVLSFVSDVHLLQNHWQQSRSTETALFSATAAYLASRCQTTVPNHRQIVRLAHPPLHSGGDHSIQEAQDPMSGDGEIRRPAGPPFCADHLGRRQAQPPQELPLRGARARRERRAAGVVGRQGGSRRRRRRPSCQVRVHGAREAVWAGSARPTGGGGPRWRRTRHDVGQGCG